MSSRIPLQTLPLHGQALVEARRWPWMIRGRIAHGDVGCLHVVPLAADAPDLDTLLVPFDEVGQPRMRPRPRAVSRHWLRRWVAGWPATAWPAIPVASGIDCPISLFPYQCAPVQAIVEGAGARVMLADRVGAGKTIEAGLIVAELAARQAADRVLVLVPSSLGDQWRDELASRCRVVLTLVDPAAFAARQRQTPPGLGPFDAPARLVMSIDLAKQPDVLAHLAATTWDVLVVDEAHTACGDSARMAAAQAIGRRARVVVLATATPHAGDDEAFARLCRIGDLGEGPLLWFRHDAAADVRPGAPRVRDVRARRSPAEREAHALVQRYVRRLDAAGAPSARLAAAVLRKRALSSPAALWRSLRHRAEWLADRREGLCQTLLSFDDQEQDHADAAQPVALCGPGFADAHGELRLLQPALDAARRAAGDWGKARAIARLLARTREPALIFTEYRDTLDAVVEAIAARGEHVALHGGLDRAARRAALERFLSGAARVLVATDIAAEGLNLQQRCRLVVHVELPWSPARLEQRAGRVDRMGQRRRVHVWRLLGEPAHEARLVAALSARVARLRAAGFDVAPAAAFATAEGGAPGPGAAVGQERAGRADRLCADSVRIRRLLHRCRRPGAPAGATNRGHLAWRRARNPGGLPRGVLVVCLTQPAVRGVRAALVPVHVELSAWPAGSPSVWLPALARRAAAAVAAERALPAALSERERRLLAAAEAEQARVAGRWQASLFERRAARVVAAAREAAAMRAAEHRRRLNELDAGVEPPAIPVVALLVG